MLPATNLAQACFSSQSVRCELHILLCKSYALITNMQWAGFFDLLSSRPSAVLECVNKNGEWIWCCAQCVVALSAFSSCSVEEWMCLIALHLYHLLWTRIETEKSLCVHMMAIALLSQRCTLAKDMWPGKSYRVWTTVYSTAVPDIWQWVSVCICQVYHL